MNKSRAKVEIITIYIFGSMSCHYSLTSQNEGLLPNPLFLSSTFSGEKLTCQFNKWVTWFKCYDMKKRVCAAAKILFWPKLGGGLIATRTVLIYPPEHRNLGSTPRAAEACLGLYCCQKQGLIFVPTLSSMLPLLPDRVVGGKLQFLGENKPRRRRVSVGLAAPWLHNTGKSGQVKWQQHSPRGVTGSPTLSGSITAPGGWQVSSLPVAQQHSPRGVTGPPTLSGSTAVGQLEPLLQSSQYHSRGYAGNGKW